MRRKLNDSRKDWKLLNRNIEKLAKTNRDITDIPTIISQQLRSQDIELAQSWSALLLDERSVKCREIGKYT